MQVVNMHGLMCMFSMRSNQAVRKKLNSYYIFFRWPGQPTKKKPVVIQDYNQHIMGVDRLDQMMVYFSFERKSMKWWRKFLGGVGDNGHEQLHALQQAHKRGEEADTEGVVSTHWRGSAAITTLKGGRREDIALCAAVVAQERKCTSQTVCSKCSNRPPLCMLQGLPYASPYLITAH